MIFVFRSMFPRAKFTPTSVEQKERFGEKTIHFKMLLNDDGYEIVITASNIGDYCFVPIFLKNTGIRYEAKPKILYYSKFYHDLDKNPEKILHRIEILYGLQKCMYDINMPSFEELFLQNSN